MVSKVSLVSNYSNYLPQQKQQAFAGNIHPTISGKNLLFSTLIALSTINMASCQFNEPDYNPIPRKAVYDPCCGSTQTQFKDITNPLEKFDLMLNNLGIIDRDKISWNDIDSIEIQGDDGSEFLLENRGVLLDGGCMDFAITRKFAGGEKDSVICRMTNGYGGIDLKVKATNNELIDNIPTNYTHIWQGKKGKDDNRFVIVNTAPDGLWDNVVMIERKNNNTIEVLKKNNERYNILLDTIKIYEK